MFKKIIGLFSDKLKSLPDIIYKPAGYIINNKVYKIDDISKYFIIELENSNHSFEELFIEFLLIKTLHPIDILTILIYYRNNNELKVKIEEILKFLEIDNYIFIDDYNFVKEDLEISYLNKELFPINNKIMIYNPNFIFQTNLIYDLFNRLYLFKDKLKVTLNLTNNTLVSYIKYYLQNIKDSYIFDLSDEHIIDIFYIKNLIKKYSIEKNIIVFTKDVELYKNIFPDNTVFINFDILANKISSINNKIFIKLICFALCKQVFVNDQQSIILSLILNIIQQKLNIQNNILYLYNNSIDSNFINYIKSISKNYEYEFINDIFSKPLSIAFFTRLTRFDNLEIIYQNIKSICNINFVNYKWFIFIPYNKLFNYNIPDIIKNDSNVIIFDKFMSFNKDDIYDVNLMNIGLLHKDLMLCQFIYVLDDDNLIHTNLINVIRKNIDKYLIINRLELTDKQKHKEHLLNIECPLNLSEYDCIGKVDYANCVFSVTALKTIGGFNLNNGSEFSDGATVLTFINSGIEAVYSNEIAGYYNKLIKE